MCGPIYDEHFLSQYLLSPSSPPQKLELRRNCRQPLNQFNGHIAGNFEADVTGGVTGIREGKVRGRK